MGTPSVDVLIYVVSNCVTLDCITVNPNNIFHFLQLDVRGLFKLSPQ
jgi:hypothetical protein